MKLKFCLVLLVILTTYNSESYSQTITARAGINSSTFNYPPAPEEFTVNIKEEKREAAIGPHAGVVIETPSKHGFSLQSGVFLSHKGETVEYTFKDTTYQKRSYGSYSMYYFEVPVTGKYALKLYKNTGIYVLAGVYFGYGATGYLKYDYDLFGKSYIGKREIWGKQSYQMWKRADAGAVMGVGLQSGRIGLEYNYYLGIADNSVDTEELADITHRVMKLGLTFRISSRE